MQTLHDSCEIHAKYMGEISQSLDLKKKKYVVNGWARR